MGKAPHARATAPSRVTSPYFDAVQRLPDYLEPHLDGALTRSCQFCFVVSTRGRSQALGGATTRTIRTYVAYFTTALLPLRSHVGADD